MSSPAPDVWSELVRQTLSSYDEPLLRQVAGKLCKPRGQWPVSDLIDRCVDVFSNPPLIDRRLKELEPSSRQLLAVIGRSRQPRWPVGSLVEIMTALGCPDGLAAVQAVLDAGMLFPVLGGANRVRHFEQWLAQSVEPMLQAPPTATQRALDEPLPLTFADGLEWSGPVQESDGLDWPLRLATLWQQLAAQPLRRTQQRDFFKRDLDRLREDPLLSTAPADALGDVPDPGLFTAALALATGLIENRESDLCAGEFCPAWNQPLPALTAELLSAVPRLVGWNAARGWEPGAGPGNPYPAANLLALLALANLPEGAWATPESIENWLLDRHPYWRVHGLRADLQVKARRGSEKMPPESPTGIARFLLGIAYPLRLLQACRGAGNAWAVRLSPLGRWALGYRDMPPEAAAFPQTLLVQPNLEILVYRQGLTPELIVKLTRFATWRTLGAACTLQLEPDRVYRAFELGESLTSIMQTLERHGMKPTPLPVLEALKTWSNKHERITVYPAAVLLEFATPADLNEALARGLPAVRLTDRLAAVANESQIDYKHFRLTGTRDYCLPPEPCVEVDADGVTLSVDLSRSDLLLESELLRYAEPLAAPAAPGRRAYRLTPATLAAARAAGQTLSALASWFEQRTGLPLSAAARLLFSGAELPPAELRRQLVLHVASADVADGLMQWPATAALIQQRLGPTALAVAEQHSAKLLQHLQETGVRVLHEEG